MAPSGSPRRPAVPFAIAFVAGVALERALPAELAPAILLVAAVAGGAAWLARGRAAGRAALLALAGCAGLLLATRERVAADARVAGWLPSDGSAVEVHVEGRLLAAPEPCDGERRLRIEGRPETGPRSARPCTVLLTVPEPPPDAASSLDRLRRGDRLRVWCRLRRPRPPGNPGEPDLRLALLARGVDAVGSIKSPRLIRLLEPGPRGVARALDSLKVAARRRLRQALGDDPAATAVVGAMLLGDQGMLRPDAWLLLRDSGLVHLLSISGLHVGLAVALLLATLRRLRLPRWGVLAAASAVLPALAVLVGGEPPVLRSVLTAILALAGRLIGRGSDPLNALALAAAALVSARPAYVWDPSFELTFAATAGILALSPRMASFVPAPRWLALPLAVSSAAYLTTAPITAWHFGRLSPAALLSNVAAAVLCGAVLASGSLALALVGVPLAGVVAARLATLSVSATLAVASGASALPGAAFRVAPPPLAIVAAYAGLLAVELRRGSSPSPPRASRPLRLLLLLCLVAIHVGPIPPGPSGRGLDVTVLDVGQGQSVLLRGPTGRFVLVDAGGTQLGRFDAGERVVAPALSRLACRRLEALVVSHDHDDHAGGAAAVLRDFDVGEVWIAAGAPREARVQDLVGQAVARGVAVVLAGRGFRACPAGIPVEVLHPPAESPARAPNERCLVIRAGPPGSRVLIPADLQSPEEERLLGSGLDVGAEALIVGHHGSVHGSGEPFLRAVRPGLAVISAGLGNRFGHPAPSLLARLRARGVAVYRTDLDGQVRLRGSAAGFAAEVTRTAGPE